MTTTILQTAGQPKTSEHIGQVGDRVRVEGVVKTMFGYSPVMHIIEDISGNQFIVRRKKSMVRERGALVTIEADVMEHRLYKGVKQTVLSAGAQEIVAADHAFLRKA